MKKSMISLKNICLLTTLVTIVSFLSADQLSDSWYGNTYTEYSELYNESSPEIRRSAYQYEKFNVQTVNPSWEYDNGSTLTGVVDKLSGIFDEEESISDLEDEEKELMRKQEKHEENTDKLKEKIELNEDGFMTIKKEMAEIRNEINNEFDHAYLITPDERKQIRQMNILPAPGLSLSRWKPSKPSRPSTPSGSKPKPQKKEKSREQKKQRSNNMSYLGYKARDNRKKRKELSKRLDFKGLHAFGLDNSVKDLKKRIKNRKEAKKARGTGRGQGDRKRRNSRTEPEPRLSDRERRKRERKSKEEKKKDQQAKKKAREAKREEKKKNLKAGKGFYTNDQITAINTNDGDIFKGLFQSATGIDMTGWGEVAESPWNNLSGMSSENEQYHTFSIEEAEPLLEDGTFKKIEYTEIAIIAENIETEPQIPVTPEKQKKRVTNPNDYPLNDHGTLKQTEKAETNPDDYPLTNRLTLKPTEEQEEKDFEDEYEKSIVDKAREMGFPVENIKTEQNLRAHVIGEEKPESYNYDEMIKNYIRLEESKRNPPPPPGKTKPSNIVEGVKEGVIEILDNNIESTTQFANLTNNYGLKLVCSLGEMALDKVDPQETPRFNPVETLLTNKYTEIPEVLKSTKETAKLAGKAFQDPNKAILTTIEVLDSGLQNVQKDFNDDFYKAVGKYGTLLAHEIAEDVLTGKLLLSTLEKGTDVARATDKAVDRVDDSKDTLKSTQKIIDNEDEIVDIPTLEVKKSRIPSIAENIETAQQAGKPKQLTRTTDKSQILKNRKSALKGKEVQNSSQSLDEYPFASTYEGGKGAQVKSVPKIEQNIQGGELGQFYKRHNIADGDRFNVEIIDDSKLLDN